MKLLLFPVTILLIGLSAVTQSPLNSIAQTDWQEWQRRNPTYPNGTGTTPAPRRPSPSPAIPQPSLQGPQPFPQPPKPVPQRSEAVGNVQVMQARLDGTLIAGKIPYPRINLSIQNLTNNRVSNIKITYQIKRGFDILDSFSLQVDGQVAPGESRFDWFPIQNLREPSPQELNQYRIRIVAITWTNTDGSKGENTQWGQMDF
jgi:hypothetical protein